MSVAKSILLATDFTQAADVAQEVAVRLSWKFGSRINLLHVVEPVKGSPELQAKLHEQLESVVRDFADELVAKRVDIVDATTVVGKPLEEILKKAQELEPDLIVIGAGKQTKFTSFQIGPIAEAVMQRASAPVLACRPGLPAPIFKKIVCPIDHSQTSRHALMNAIRFARSFQSELIVVTVFAETAFSNLPAYNDEFSASMLALEEGWAGEFEDFLSKTDFEGVTWKKEFLKGKPSTEIVAACLRNNADILVMGSAGRGALGTLLMGSVTARVLRSLPCSILTLKHQDVLDESLDEEMRTIRILVAEANEFHRAQEFRSALVKCRQILARDPYHDKALEIAAASCEELGDADNAKRYRARSERSRRILQESA